ncbi:hypothetical protein TNCV_1252631 [Trichonephila clavipes]|nr:hypothetical protein TNCV_1252631 [Trichonephila clavipes]
MPAVSTSPSSAQTHLLPSTSAEIPTIQKTETRPLTTSNKFTALQTSIPLSESATTTPNSELSNTSKVPQNVKQNPKNRRKHAKAQKAEIEIKMTKHKPRKSGPTELTTDEEDMIMYEAQAEELEPNPDDEFAVMECFVNNPSEYRRASTPTRFRKRRIAGIFTITNRSVSNSECGPVCDLMTGRGFKEWELLPDNQYQVDQESQDRLSDNKCVTSEGQYCQSTGFGAHRNTNFETNCLQETQSCWPVCQKTSSLHSPHVCA